MKPQSILIYCYKNSNAFESVSHILSTCLGKNKYTVNRLDESECWIHHCSLIVIASYPHDISFRAINQINQFSKTGGKILCMGGYFSYLLPLNSINQPHGPCLDEICNRAAVLSHGQGIKNSLVMLPIKLFSDSAVLSQTLHELGIQSHKDADLKLQPLEVHSLSTEALNSFFMKMKTCCYITDDDELMFPLSDSHSDETGVLILKNESTNGEFFDCLENSNFPEIFIHSKAVISTQDLLWKDTLITSSCNSVVVLADTQLSGKGRGKNQWISPHGSMCMSFYFSLKQETFLGSKLPFVQYIAALATVQAINDLCGSTAPVKIKWPNDIYSANNVKIGGVLVNCSSDNDLCNLCVGIGLNVNNSEPTISLSQLSGCEHSIQKMARKICNYFMNEVDTFNKLGIPQFVERFCDRWMHQNKQVKISVGSIDCSAIIKSIDNDGYLSVFNLVTSEMVSVQPDGNSFDMMENLIAVKSKM